MRIGKALRNILLERAETYVLSPTSCMYFNEKYTYEAVTQDDIEVRVQHLLSILNKKSWAERVLENLGLKK